MSVVRSVHSFATVIGCSLLAIEESGVEVRGSGGKSSSFSVNAGCSVTKAFSQCLVTGLDTCAEDEVDYADMLTEGALNNVVEPSVCCGSCRKLLCQAERRGVAGCGCMCL